MDEQEELSKIRKRIFKLNNSSSSTTDNSYPLNTFTTTSSSLPTKENILTIATCSSDAEELLQAIDLDRISVSSGNDQNNTITLHGVITRGKKHRKMNRQSMNNATKTLVDYKTKFSDLIRGRRRKAIDFTSDFEHSDSTDVLMEVYNFNNELNVENKESDVENEEELPKNGQKS
ncbi:hypothetical protein ABEB36_012092 [Hypothenemus hampei]|uniref:Uncharacterized protein n=1 Tax=Hypothenemus hampei TaxID=57062 RepID=A0ABD1EAC0_HYPHA